MSKVWLAAGRLSYWLAWPALVIYLQRSNRTRIIITHGSECLVLKNWLGNGDWCLPGGGLHTGEPSLQGAVRELCEETGIVVVESQLKPLGSFHFRRGGLNFPYELFSLALSEKPTLRPQPWEVSELAWVDRTRFSRKNAGPDVLQAIAQWPR